MHAHLQMCCWCQVCSSRKGRHSQGLGSICSSHTYDQALSSSTRTLSMRSNPGCGWRQSTSAFPSKHRWTLLPSNVTTPAVPHHQRSSPPYGTPHAATIAMNLLPTLPPAEQAGWTSRAARSLLPWSLLQACPCSERRRMSRTCCQCPPAVLCSPLAAQVKALHAITASQSCRGHAKGGCMALRSLQAADAPPPM